MPIFKDYHILTSIPQIKGIKRIIMTYITEEEEKELDNIGDGCIELDRGNTTFTITGRSIYCYGEVNFESEEDLNTIDSFRFLGHLQEKGVSVPTDYDYKEHCCYSPTRRYRHTETFKPSVLAKYSHGRLGKPERIVLFKM